MDNNSDKNYDTEYSENHPNNIEVLDLDDDVEVLDLDDDNKVSFQINLNSSDDNIDVLDFELEFNDSVEDVEILDFDINENSDSISNVLDEIEKQKDDAIIISDVTTIEQDKSNVDIEKNIDVKDAINTFDNHDKVPDDVIKVPENKIIGSNDVVIVDKDGKVAVADDLKVSKETFDLVQATFKKKKRRLLIILAILLIALSFVVYKIVKWNVDNSAINKQIKDIMEEAEIVEVKNDENTVVIDSQPQTIEDYTEIYIEKSNDYYRFIDEPLINVNFTNLLEKNSDTVAWLKVNGTNINYPVVQSSDNKYYLTHAYDKTYNDAGWIFADYRNNLTDDRNLIIYGHARLNSTMFGTLKNVIKRDWYSNRNNYVIKLSTPNVNSTWQVFSTYAIDPEDYYLRTSFESDSSFYEFAKILKARSIYDYNVEIKPTDRILTLSTCYSNNQRVVLHAKLIKYENRS